jgi:hypothetical protein
MPDRPKPPVRESSRSGGRHDGATIPGDSGDSGGFSIETTTMRLKSLKLRRAEVVDQQISDAIKPARPASAELASSGPAGRVRHDERGVAVWDWAVATGEFCTLSTTVALRKLEVADLKIEDHKTPELKLEVSGRDKAGGFDPYNQRGSGKRQGEAAQRAGITGSPERGPVLDQLTGKKK